MTRPDTDFVPITRPSSAEMHRQPDRGKDQRSVSGPELELLGLRHLMASEVIRLSADRMTATAVLPYTMVATRDAEHGYRRGSHEGSYVFEFRNERGS